MPTPQKTRKEEIVESIEELKLAFLECEAAKEMEENLKLRVQKAHKRLSLAQDVVRGLNY